MESNGMYSNIGPGMLGLEMSLHHQIPPQQNPNHIQQQQQPHHQPMVSFDHHQQSEPSARQNIYPYGNKPKAQGLTLSDEDEPAGGPTEQSSAEDGKRKMSPWQRMKWTDDMVRLLIMVVYYIGDEGAPDGASEKKGSHGILQKKGKWKSVSRAMMERGFSVSPQQCEDKFNDLNKRYKRVNDILGKGTACRVVENQSLLETMDLSPKMKEEVKKLLNSKHLFFREMCAYHNSCGGSSGGSSEPPQTPQQKCLHSHEKPNLSRGETEGSRSVKTGEEEGESEDEEDDDVDDDHGEQSHEEEDDETEQGSRKRQKTGVSFSSSVSPMVQQLSTELTNLCQDGSRNPLEKRHWIRARMMQLEEQQLRFDAQKLELEKQRLKWIKYSGKKEREMEKEKLTNERKRLENDRMVLLLQQKELELLDHLHHQRTSDPSSVTG